MEVKICFKELKEKMSKTIDVYHQELSGVRTGVASTALVEHLNIDCYGSVMPLNQVATVTAPEPRTLIIQPWDMNNLSAIEKSIMKSDLGLMPNNDGKIIRINIPPLNEERRGDLIKLVKKMTEDVRIAIRNVRREANDRMKKMLKNKEITEDQEKEALEDIQKVTDEKIEDINKALKHKEQEMLKI